MLRDELFMISMMLPSYIRGKDTPLLGTAASLLLFAAFVSLRRLTAFLTSVRENLISSLCGAETETRANPSIGIHLSLMLPRMHTFVKIRVEKLLSKMLNSHGKRKIPKPGEKRADLLLNCVWKER